VSAARSIISSTPGGIRYSALVDAIALQSPETPRNTVNGAVWNLDALFPNEIAKPSRGLFTPVQGGSEGIVVGKTEEIAESGTKVRESDFYEPFAELLKNDLGDVVEIVELGGAGLKSNGQLRTSSACPTCFSGHVLRQRVCRSAEVTRPR
jgi:hypothetical protein